MNGRRGMVEEEEKHKEVGVREEEVKRILRLIMPYLNESLLQLRALFSGDPSTTLKVSVPSPSLLLSIDLSKEEIMMMKMCRWEWCFSSWPGVALLSPFGTSPNLVPFLSLRLQDFVYQQ